MVEVIRDHNKKEAGLFVPEQKQLTSADIAEMFGPDYKKSILSKAEEVGIKEPLRFFDNSLPHNGSQAVYIVEQFVGDDWILVSVLEPYMKTSKHHHKAPMVKEKYLHIAGESFVAVDENVIALNEKNSHIEVSLNVNHQVTTRKSPALTLIVMENARLVPPGRLHIKN